MPVDLEKSYLSCNEVLKRGEGAQYTYFSGSKIVRVEIQSFERTLQLRLLRWLEYYRDWQINIFHRLFSLSDDTGNLWAAIEIDITTFLRNNEISQIVWYNLNKTSSETTQNVTRDIPFL